MALSSSVHDLRTLIRSCHPLITIETVEEERVLALLQSVAAQERMPLFEWSVTRGLTRHDDGPALSKMTATPLAVLQHLQGLTVEAIFWLKDLAPHLQDAAVARQLREVAAIYDRSVPELHPGAHDRPPSCKAFSTPSTIPQWRARVHPPTSATPFSAPCKG